MGAKRFYRFIFKEPSKYRLPLRWKIAICVRYVLLKRLFMAGLFFSTERYTDTASEAVFKII